MGILFFQLPNFGLEMFDFPTLIFNDLLHFAHTYCVTRLLCYCPSKFFGIHRIFAIIRIIVAQILPFLLVVISPHRSVLICASFNFSIICLICFSKERVSQNFGKV